MPARKKQQDDTPAGSAKGRKTKAKAAPKSAVIKKPAAKKARTASKPRPGGNGEFTQDLVIVESPAKTRTLAKYLGSGFRVMASMGHVRDLPKRKKAGQIVAGIDKNWQATYEVIDDRKKKNLDDLEREAARSNHVYLATDPDREGEAIAWHLKEVLDLDDERTFRITFNEITRSAVQGALANAGKIDMDRVRAQEARRILDRVVGFPLSGLLNRKVKPRSSAGRVQSVALKLVVDREREIEAFVSAENWKITATLAPAGTVPFEFKPFSVALSKAARGLAPEQDSEAKARLSPLSPRGRGAGGEGESAKPQAEDPLTPNPSGERGEGSKRELPDGAFLAELAEWDGKKFGILKEGKDGKPAEVAEAARSRESAGAVAALLDKAKYQITKIEQKDRDERPSPPFTTSTLQQQANLRLHFTADRTMKTAQKLYEGVPLGDDGSVALITYMRTDSTRVANEALQAVRTHIDSSFGPAYLPEKPNFYASGKSAQEAHEAIRPTDLSYTPERVAALGLHGDQLRLYTLIYTRFVASQMKPAVWAVTNVEVTATTEPGTVGLFKAQGRILKFDGFRKVYHPAGKLEDATLPPLSEKQDLDRINLVASQHFTQPPPRYNEASLVKALEKEGIGRPSTYAAIMQKITDEEKGYILVKDRRFFATDVGKTVTDLLVKWFPRVMDLKFTSHFEEELDQIETRQITYDAVLNEFWAPFSETLKEAEKDMPSQRGVETGEKCPECGRPLVRNFSKKTGREFIGCSGWKEGCKYIKPREGEEEVPRPVETEHKCPTCGKPMIQWTGPTGPFLACSDKECKTKMNFDAEGKPVLTAKPTEHVCEKCGKPMIERIGPLGKKFLGCSGFPKCRTTKELDERGNPVQPLDTGVRCDKCNSPMVIKTGRRGPFLACTGYPKCRNAKSLTDELKEKFKDQLPAPPEKKQLPEVKITETCPECGGEMKLRESTRGRKRGYFLGCKKYPKCKGTREAPPQVLEQLQEAGATP